MCMMFCITYTLTCVCLLIPWLPILLFGRLLGGISTAILYSAFESWLISSSTSLALSQSDLSTILGRATLVNGFVATGAGVLSNKLVSFTHSFASPFVASAALLVLGWVVIRSIWAENYGGGGGLQADSDVLQLKRLGKAWKLVYDGKDPILGFTILNHAKWKCRPYTPCSWTYPDLLRGVDVLVRLSLGSSPSRGVQNIPSPITTSWLYLFLVYDIDDAWICPLHLHRQSIVVTQVVKTDTFTPCSPR